LTSHDARSRNNKRWRIAAAGAAVVLLAGGIAIRSWLFTDLPDVRDLSAGLQKPSIRITDRYGHLLYEVIGEDAGRNTVVPLAEIPQACQQATIATEDADFYTNPGVDARAIARAIWINVQGGEVISGGSTITQQVARNLLLDPQERAERTLTRKLRESILAYRLAQNYSKDEILALYLNQTYYGNLAYGIDAAARAMFGKSVAELDLAECALLAGLPQAPSLYDPLSDPEASKTRQEVVLGLMVDHGAVTQDQADAAARESLAFAAERYSIEAPHFVMAVVRQLEETIPPEVLYGGGLEVKTTLDLDWQHTAERIARRHLELLNTPTLGDPPHNATDAALVALDPHTGQVLAMLGSPDYFDTTISGAVNMALARRQPGSSIKPITYAAALDPTQPEPMTAATMLLDVSTSFVTHEGFAYTPVNFDREEHGPVLAREALASSYNIPAVIVLKTIGMDRLFQLAARMGLTTFTDPSSYDLSITLGGGEVRLVEMVEAYAAFANGGQRVHSTMILRVTNEDGDVVWQPDSFPPEQVIDPRVAWLISDILSDNLARAPTYTTHSILQIARPAAVKTGTTTDFRDNWTIGYTPNLVVGVWVGNASSDPMIGISGVSGAGPIWHQFMRTVLRGQPALTFDRPDGMTQLTVCALSGLLPTPACPYTRDEWFIDGTAPSEPDAIYQQVTLDAATGLPANDHTPPERRETRVYLDLPPQAHEWARRLGLDLLPDSMAAASAAGDAAEGLVIASPDAYTIYKLSPEMPAESQRLRLVAAGPPGMHDVTIYVDGSAVGSLNEAPFSVWWPLIVGDHTVYASGITGDGRTLTSEERPFRVNPPD
jgi:1A family penicillin-binding protein